MFATFFEVPAIVAASCSAGIALLLVGLLAAKNEVGKARGLDKVVALRHLCFAIPIAVFGAEHFSAPEFLLPAVPAYMPWRLFWVYFIGSALIAASLSIATRIGVRWSGLLFGLMMFLFVAMIHLPGALAQHDRVLWVIVFRETSFGGAGWILAATALNGWHGQTRSALNAVGRTCIVLALVVFGIQHFLHPTLLPGVPLRKELPVWIPGRVLIDYVTGTALLVTAGSVVLSRHARIVVSLLGSWMLLMIVVIYGPILIASLFGPTTGVKMEGINYFADTLLFAGVILALASAYEQSSPTDASVATTRNVIDHSRVPDGDQNVAAHPSERTDGNRGEGSPVKPKIPKPCRSRATPPPPLLVPPLAMRTLTDAPTGVLD
jgi:uncharacterized membrane protein